MSSPVPQESSIRWTWHRWAELTPDTLHALLKLRSDVFIVEQNCAYPDIDGLDPRCDHLCGLRDGAIVACARLVPPGTRPAHGGPHPAIGRLAVAASARRQGLARRAIELGLARCAERFPGMAVFGQAQKYLLPFYLSLGGVPQGAEYVEDGIPHQDLLIPAR